MPNAVASIWFEIWKVVDPDLKKSIFPSKFRFFRQFSPKKCFRRALSHGSPEGEMPLEFRYVTKMIYHFSF